MKISAQFATPLDSPEHIETAEALGYNRAWLFDTPHQSPDVGQHLVDSNDADAAAWTAGSWKAIPQTTLAGTAPESPGISHRSPARASPR